MFRQSRFLSVKAGAAQGWKQTQLAAVRILGLTLLLWIESPCQKAAWEAKLSCMFRIL